MLFVGIRYFEFDGDRTGIDLLYRHVGAENAVGYVHSERFERSARIEVKRFRALRSFRARKVGTVPSRTVRAKRELRHE